uniref:protein-tyrosine-phosphatase n=1 Tax=Tetranychus urticae TaxID=32264 RepID=T1JQM1_TETUR
MMDSENMVMHSDSITNIFDISCEVLEQYLKTKSNVMLVIDCRPFLAHNESHIVNAINVHCPPILRRRTGGRLPLKTIITDIVVRERLIAGQFFPVILYEDSILNSSESTCGFVARCLQQETSLEFIYILKGGYQQFAHRYPNSCTRNGHLISPGYSNLIKSPSAGHLTWLTVKNGTTVGSFYKGNHSPRTPKALNTIYGPLYMDNSIHLVTRESDQGEPVEILPYLYLGSGYHASCKRNLEKLGITALLNVSQNCPNYFEDTFIYKCIPVEDSSSEEISLWFDEAIDFIA